MSDMTAAIKPKSDQLNSDDLIGGPITVTITGVTVTGGADQPVAIAYEGDRGKPYKPCKSMCRVLVYAWGADSVTYVGRSMTLYRDPSVKWGGMAVGGIRISHLSEITKPLSLALTETRANRKIFTVNPLKVEPPPPKSPATLDLWTPAGVMQCASAGEWLATLHGWLSSGADNAAEIFEKNLRLFEAIDAKASARKEEKIMSAVAAIKTL